MIVEHETFIRKNYEYSMSKPFESTKFLLENAFGLAGSRRPVFRSSELNCVKMVNDENSFDLVFSKLNYDYIDSLPVEDISVFSEIDFGHFFYEYGRTLLAITAMTLSRVEWFIEKKDLIPELDKYYSAFLKLSDKLENVISEFRKNMEYDEDVFEFDFKAFSENVRFLYDDSRNYKNSPDINNSDIVLAVYIGLLFVILGTLLTLPNESIDVMSYLKSLTPSSMDSILDKIFNETINTVQLPEELKTNLVKLIFIFNGITTLYDNTSGVKVHDDIITALQKFSKEFLKRSNSDDVEFFEDISTLIKCARNYNIFNEINSFTSALPSSDNTDIWLFGFKYMSFYKLDKFVFDNTENENADPDAALKFYKPAMTCFLDNTITNSPTNLEIEKGFNFISALLNNLDNEKATTVDPRTILVLTILGSAFRKIEKKNNISNDTIISEKVHSGVDLIDTLIIALYNLWFNSGKYFRQVKRPFYCEEGAASTLNLLKKEVNDILLTYFEYVRFGTSDNIYKSDETIFKDYFKNKILNVNSYGDEKFITQKFFLPLDPEVFVRECAIRGCRSLTYTLLTDDKALSLNNLCELSSNTTIPKTVLRTLADTKNENFTGIKVLDKVIYALPVVKDYVQETPFVYMLTIYCVMLDSIQKIFETNNVGNFFDFGKAELATDTYKLDSMVSELILKPTQKIENADLL